MANKENHNAAAYALPDAKTLEAASRLEVLDSDRNKVSFKSLTVPVDGAQLRLVIFIRHFYCGHCEEYVHTLTSELPIEKLASNNTRLSIVGCGDPSCIPDYKVRTHCPFEIYADPDRKLYDTLGMTSTLQLGPKNPDYIKTSLLGNICSSALNVIKSGSKAWKGGKSSQNGGEWLFDLGELKWCKRMQNTRDHAEMVELAESLGIKI